MKRIDSFLYNRIYIRSIDILYQPVIKLTWSHNELVLLVLKSES